MTILYESVFDARAKRFRSTVLLPLKVEHVKTHSQCSQGVYAAVASIVSIFGANDAVRVRLEFHSEQNTEGTSNSLWMCSKITDMR